MESRAPAEARRAVQELARHKADFVKIWVDTRNGTRTKLSPEMFSAAADEATRLGMRSIAHVFDLADAKLLVKAGVEGFLIGHPHVMYRMLQASARRLRNANRWRS